MPVFVVHADILSGPLFIDIHKKSKSTDTSRGTLINNVSQKHIIGLSFWRNVDHFNDIYVHIFVPWVK